MIKRLLVLSVVIIISEVCYAQDPYVDLKPIPFSSLQGAYQNNDGTYTNKNISVDLFTGIGTVNIPIYDYSVDGLNLGVSLNYAANGIKVNQTASSVGLGWSLNAGGYIDRTVNGMEDEITYPGYALATGVTYGPRGMSRDRNINHAPGDTYINESRGQWVDPLTTDSAHTSKEGNSDIFNANIPGGSFNFSLQCVYDPNATPPHPSFYNASSISGNQDYNVSVFLDGVYKTPCSFPNTIGTDPNQKIITFEIDDKFGNKFEFQRGDYEIKVSTNKATYYPSERWVLKKITTSTHKIIEYTYNTYDLTYDQYKSDVVNEQLVDAGKYMVAPGRSGNSNAVIWKGKVSCLSSIKYPDGTVVSFTMASNTRCDLLNSTQLEQINIKKGNTNVYNQLTYKLNYAYYNSITGSSLASLSSSEAAINTGACQYITNMVSADGKTSADATTIVSRGLRLKLKSIERWGTDNSVEPYYSFSYNENQLPPRLSPSQDWYGYYNGQTPVNLNGIAYSIPLHTVYTKVGAQLNPYQYGVNKGTNGTYAQYGILNQVKNALGGTMDLSYLQFSSISAPNYPNYTFSNNIAEGAWSFDGLEIRELKYTDNYTNNSESIRFNSSGGFTFFPGGFCWYPLTDTFVGVENWSTPIISERAYTNNFVTPMDFFHGSNHGFSKVGVYISNALTNEFIKQYTYEFSNITTDILADDKSAPNFNILPRAYMQQSKMGLLTSLQEYNSDLAFSTPYQETKYTYEFLNYRGGGIGRNSMQNNESFFYWAISHPSVNPIWDQAHDSHVDRVCDVFDPTVARLKSTTTIVKSGNQNQVSAESYTYTNNHDVRSVIWTDSKNTTFRKMFWYLYDNLESSFSGYFVNDSLTYNDAYFSQLPFAPVKIETERWDDRNYSIDDPNHLSMVAYTQILPELTLGNYLRAIKVANSTLRDPVQYNTFYSNGINTFYTYDQNVSDVKKYTKFDSHDNPLEVWSDNDLSVTSFIWDTRTDQKIAEAVNTPQNEIAFTSFEGTFLSGGDENKGNWNFNPSYIQLNNGSNKGMTGHYWYKFDFTPSSAITSVNALTNNKKYIVSFWCKGYQPLVELNTPSGYQIQTLTQQYQVGDWKLYTAYITGNGQPLAVWPTGAGVSEIDELRLYPADATMNTYTNEPLFGVSSQCDDRNNIVYYEYDPQGRISVVKDVDGNIRSVTKTVIQGNDN